MRHHHDISEELGDRVIVKPRFPYVAFTVAFVALALLFYEIFIGIPGAMARGELPHLDENWWGMFFRAVSVTLGSVPLVAAFLFAGALAPGFFRSIWAPRYYHVLAVCVLGAWATCFVVAVEPARRLGESIHELLSMERTFPETIRGQ